MVLLRMFSGKPPYIDVLEKIKEKCNRIVFSTSINKEWRSKAHAEGMSALIILRKLEELEQIKKLKKCKQTLIGKAQKLIQTKKCRKPTDHDDLKFVEVALAEKAILITKDRVLLSLNPYNCGKITLKIVSPEDYLKNSRNS